MRTLDIVTLAVSTAALAGCTETFRAEPTRTVTVSGNYATVADCVYSALAVRYSPRKDDQASMRQSTITIGLDTDLSKLVFKGTGANTTQASMYVANFGAFPDSWWSTMFKGPVEQCSG